jgi:hypothetical protein
MAYYSPFVGPFSQFPIPSNVIVAEPASDNTIDIGTATKRYRSLYATDVKTTSIECSTITASTSISVPSLTATTATITTLTATTGSVNGHPIAVNTGGTSVSGNLVSFSDTTGNDLKDSGVASTAVVTGPGSSTNGNLAVFNGTGGTQLSDGGTLSTFLAAYLPLTGGTLTGDVSLGTHTIGGFAGNFTNMSNTSLLTHGIAVSGGNITVGGISTIQNAGGTSVAGNLPKYSDTTGDNLTDSGRSVTSFPFTFFSLSPYEQVTISNSNTQVTLLGTGNGSLTIPANTTRTGSFIEMNGRARIGQILTGSTFTIQVMVNGVALPGAGTAWSATGGASAVKFDLAAKLWLDTGNCFLDVIITDNHNATGPLLGGAAEIAAWDPTIANTLDLQGAFSVASASNNLVWETFTAKLSF